jgi:hypothetical protein
MKSPDSALHGPSVVVCGRKMTPQGLANRKARDRARRRALSRMIARYRSEFYALTTPGQRGSWGNAQGPARVIRDRHPRVWERLLAEELAKEDVVELHLGKRNPYRAGKGSPDDERAGYGQARGDG